MTVGTAYPETTVPALLRLARLHLTSRRVPAALAAIVACAVVLRIALHWRWNAYGAFQLPLIFEAGCAAVIATASTGPFGEPERVAGRWLPLLRLATTLTLTAVAAGALAAAGLGTDLAGGTGGLLRNLAGLTGIALLCAVFFGGALGWTGSTAYLVIATYGLYTQWHGPALTTPWIWPARPSADIGAALCAGLVFLVGVAAIAFRGARDASSDRDT
ncbi:hypothetical protein Ais01nite_13190 [Asanoa ishikariensis]|uniref:ABC-2 type transport system permease protein n=1 Tax=Asanoa ishikariensis TaxID=137265 RepID=A0A1H3SYR8_9ACTN|nr:hypothetical protein [Asanoa ishikariensis]GIF63284.1 hypothetical protein Ais01nite_13190 [Asanoa ishikariensis]SDZ42778.1 hypothetical protein SAMN05421684_4908 [Asanoa ishikariensis]